MFGSRLRTRVEVLEKKLEELDEAYSRVTELEADWQDWLHKIRNVLARLNQRARAEELDPPAAPGASRGNGIRNPLARKLLGFPEED